MNRLLAPSILIIFALLLTACASETLPPTPLSATHPTVNATTVSLIKGKTQQQQITKVLGAPNIVSKNRNGDIIWIYQNSHITSQTNNQNGILTLAAGKSDTSLKIKQMTYTTTIILHFSSSGILTDYKSMVSQF